MLWIKRLVQVGVVIAILLFVVIVLLALSEFVFRLTPLKIVTDRPEESKYYHEEHPERVIDIKPNVTDGYLSFYGNFFPTWSNELGCFDMPYGGEKPFVYLAGDSLTWGYALFEDKWGTFLEKAIGTRVLKCAVTASGTYHQYLKAKSILEKYPNPSLIVVGYFANNDVLDDFNFPQFIIRQGTRFDNPTMGSVPTEEVKQGVDTKIALYESYCVTTPPRFPFLQKIKCTLYKHSVVYNLVTNGIKVTLNKLLPQSILNKLHISPPHVEKTIFPDPQEEAYVKHFDSIRKFKELAKEQNSELLFVLIPSREEVYPDLFGPVSGEPKKRAVNFFESEGIAYLDLEPIFEDTAKKREEKNVGKRGDLYWDNEWHMSVLGNTLTGYSVASYLEDRGLFTFSPEVEEGSKEFIYGE